MTVRAPTITTIESEISTALLKRAKRFEPQALAALHDHFYPLVFRYISYRVDNVQVCEDISGEVFLRLLNYLKNGNQDIHNLRGWLYGTAHHLIQDHYRQGYRRPTDQLDDHETIPNGHNPEEETMRALAVDQVRSAMRRLTSDQQHVLALRFSQELSIQETALMMKKSVEAVKVLQFRALAALRRQLEGSR
ncbi:MAG: sigma-70 family RNA polymerase sigma factor [Chloroflexota bacterium]|jgi:RNA polymerase sigma-70 factor (ECF subfamily)